MSFIAQILFLSAFANFALAYVVFKKDTNNLVNQVFAIFASILGLWTITTVLLDMFPGYLFGSSAMSLGLSLSFVFVLFAEVYPEIDRKPSLKFYMLRFITPVGIIWILTPLRLILSDVKVLPDGSDQPVFGPLNIPLMVMVTFYMFYGIWHFVKNFRKSKGFARMQMAYLITAFLGFTLITVFSNAILPTLGIYQFLELGPAFSVFFVVIVFLAIVRHRLWDISLVLGRSAIISISLLFTAVIPVIIVVYINDNYFINWGVSRYVLPLITAIIVILIYPRIQSFFENFFGQFLIKEELSFEELLKESQKIFREEIQLHELTRKLNHVIHDALTPSWQGLVILENPSEQDHTYRIYSKGKHILTDDTIKGLITNIQKSHNDLIFTITEAKYGDLTHRDLAKLLEKVDAVVCAPFFARKRLIGILLLGPRPKNRVYSKEELDVLQVVVNQAIITLDNARLFKQTQDFNNTLQDEIEKATKDLQKAYDELKQLDRMKDELVSITSHELRTPITIIKDLLWMVVNKKKETITDPKTMEYINRSYSSSERMIKLVNDILLVSELEGERIAIKKKPFQVETLIRDVIRDMNTLAQEKGVKIKFDAVPKDTTALIDVDRFREVIVNLISNAIKYSPKDTAVEIHLEQQENSLKFSVTDHGQGISDEDRPRLFQKFGRLEGSYVSAAEKGGTGLGLYISKKIVELHEGIIWVESEPGNGSTFFVSFPLKPDTEE